MTENLSQLADTPKPPEEITGGEFDIAPASVIDSTGAPGSYPATHETEVDAIPLAITDLSDGNANVPTHPAIEDGPVSTSDYEMPRRSKDEHLIQAQVATFATEAIHNQVSKNHIINNIGRIATGELETVTRVTKRVEYETDETGKQERIPEGTEVVAATPEQYAQFLRAVGGSQYEGVKTRAEMLQAYAEFAPAVNQLKAELADPALRKQHPAYLGAGLGSKGFALTQAGKHYVVRIPDGRVNPAVVDGHVAGAVLSKGAEHLEQIVAASYLDGVTVAERVPGQEIGDLSVDEISLISDDQLKDLVHTLTDAHQRGIEIDTKSSNFLYSPDAGYGIIDFQSSKAAGKNSLDQDLGSLVGHVADVIWNAGLYGKPDIPLGEKATSDYARELEVHKADLGVLERYRNVVSQTLTANDRQRALEIIDEGIQSARETVDNYSDPQWVAETITRDAEFKLRRARNMKAMSEMTKIGPDGWMSVESDVL